jgi:ZIP family zinc transporter
VTGLLWLDAALWGWVASLGLIAGALAGLYRPLEHREVARVMAVGAGLLLAAVSLDLIVKSIDVAGHWEACVGLAAGAIVFSGINALLARRGAMHRKRCGECHQQATERQTPGSGLAIAVGTVLDLIPESMVLGLETIQSGAPAVAILAAFFLSNFPEALSGSAGMVTAGRTRTYVAAVWIGASLLGAAAAGTSAALLDGMPTQITGWISSFAAGAMLSMVVETMVPEAAHGSPRFNGVIAAAGFATIVLLLYFS